MERYFGKNNKQNNYQNNQVDDEATDWTESTERLETKSGRDDKYVARSEISPTKPFVKEHLTDKRKRKVLFKKIGRFFLLCAGAFVFGVIARIVFTTSGTSIEHLFGVKERELIIFEGNGNNSNNPNRINAAGQKSDKDNKDENYLVSDPKNDGISQSTPAITIGNEQKTPGASVPQEEVKNNSQQGGTEQGSTEQGSAGTSSQTGDAGSSQSSTGAAANSGSDSGTSGTTSGSGTSGNNQEGTGDIGLSDSMLDFSLDSIKGYYGKLKSLSNELEKSLVDLHVCYEVSDPLALFKDSPKEKNVTGLVIAYDTAQSYYVLADLSAIGEEENVYATVKSDKSYPVVLYAKDDALGIGIFRLSTEEFLEEDVEDIRVVDIEEAEYDTASAVIALGRPIGYEKSIATGMITSIDNCIYVEDGAYQIFTTNIAAISSSSGFVFDLDGNMLGMIVHMNEKQQSDPSKKSDDYLQSDSIFTVMDIPSLMPVIKDLVNGYPRTQLGLTCETAGYNVLSLLGIGSGVGITGVAKASKAYEAGLKVGDIIVSVNGITVTDSIQFMNLLTEFEPKTPLEITTYGHTIGGSVQMETKKITFEK